MVSYIYNALMNGAEIQISVEKGLYLKINIGQWKRRDVGLV